MEEKEHEEKTDADPESNPLPESYADPDADTVYALSSGGGGGSVVGGITATAVSVIRLTGPQSHDALRKLLSSGPNVDPVDVNLPRHRMSSVRTQSQN